MSLGITTLRKTSSVTFRGRNRRDVKRKALQYWSKNGRILGLSLPEFVRCCRIDGSEQQITFTLPR